MRIHKGSRRRQWELAALAAGVLLAASFFFGGGNRLHELRLAIVELASLPLLALAAYTLLRADLWKQHRLALGLVLMLLALPLVQLLPLPPAVWEGLPGRASLAQTLDLARIAPAWGTWSLTPDRTWRSFLALLPPAAMFTGILICPPDRRRQLVLLMLAGVFVSICLGALQVASSDSRLYFWPTTTPGTVVGFFANRNHLATLCLISLPFAAIIGSATVRRQRPNQLLLWASGALIVLLVIALGAIRSRVGVILLPPALIASFIGAWIASGRGIPGKPLLAGAGGTLVALIAVAIFALGPILERFDSSGVREGRFENWPIVAEAANAYLPAGSGLGSFDRVYRSVEPLARLDPTFFNQAHNDYLESWLETGWFGAGILLIFLIWYGRRSYRAWRAGPSTEHDLQRAGSIAIGLVLIHSIADYPLRTETIAVIFALAAALLELAGRVEGPRSSSTADDRRKPRSV